MHNTPNFAMPNTLSGQPTDTQYPQQPNRAQRSLLRRVLSGLAVVGAFVATAFATVSHAPAAYAHDELVGYSLVMGSQSEDASSPQAFLLNFNNELAKIGAEVNATDTNGRSIIEGAPELTGRDFTQAFVPNLEPGEYPIIWTAVSSDGHKISGGLSLSISDNAAPTLTLADPATLTAAPAEPTDRDENATASAPVDTPEAEPGTPVGVIIAAVAGGIAVLGAVVAIVIRKMRSGNTLGGAE